MAVLFCSTTGSRKSLTYEIAPFVSSTKPHCLVYCVSPLVLLMRTREKKMHSLRIRSLYLSEEGLSLCDIEKGC